MSRTTDDEAAPKVHEPSAVPPYIRHTRRAHSASSVKSNSSTRSHPHPQNEHVPIATGITTVIGTAEPLVETEIEIRHDDDDAHSEADDNVDWDEIRTRAHEGIPAWRRPRPAWIYPFLFGTAFSLGMSSAPKTELFINLTCLVHPPRQPSSAAVLNHYDYASIHAVDSRYSPTYQTITQAPINASLPDSNSPQDPTIGGEVPRSAADKWFLKLQKDIYDWQVAHPEPEHNGRHSQISTSPTSTATYKLPPGPLPQPTMSPDKPPSSPPLPNKDPQQGSEHGSEHPPFHAIDPAQCKKDSTVQAAAAKLTMALTITLGVLSALTTGYWGKMSDKIGRTKIMAIVELGLFVGQVSFILVASFPYLAPGGYRSLIIQPILEGCLGGTACLLATVYAYISDITPDGSRAGAFARLMGILMTGFAAGPMVGAMLIKATDNIMVPFYIDATVHAVWPILILLLLPESLSKEARAHLAKQSEKAAESARRKDALQREWENEHSVTPHDDDPAASGWSRISNPGHSRRRRRFVGRITRFSKTMFHFLEPLTVFAPHERLDGGRGKDWNLTLVAIAILAASMNMGILLVKVQYAVYAYGWTTTQLGPYLSISGFSRGFVLIVLLPLVIKFIKAKFFSEPSPETSPDTTPSSAPPPTASLDLITVRTSLTMEMTGLTLLSLNFGPTAFVLITLWITLGSGTTPALNSLALGLLPDKSSSGKLFGALSVLHAIGSTLLSPILFGEIFAATVGIYAPTIFAVGAFLPASALLVLSFVRLGRAPELTGESAIEGVGQTRPTSPRKLRSASPRG